MSRLKPVVPGALLLEEIGRGSMPTTTTWCRASGGSNRGWGAVSYAMPSVASAKHARNGRPVGSD